VDEPEHESVRDNPMFVKPRTTVGGYWPGLGYPGDATKRHKMSVWMQLVTGAVICGPLYLIPSAYLLTHRWLTAALWGLLTWTIAIVLIMIVLGRRWMGGGLRESRAPDRT
jgi:hypothetical protein